MKAIVIRPNLSQIPGEFFRENTRSEDPIYALIRNFSSWKYCFTIAFCNAVGVISVANKLKALGLDVDALDLIEFGVALTPSGIKTQNKKIEKVLIHGNHDLVCISCTSCVEYLATKRLAELSKKILPGAKVIVGGYHASADFMDIMQSIPQVDIINMGDFEPVAEQLIHALKNNESLDHISNIVFRKNNKIIINERKYYKLSFEKDISPIYPSPFDKYYYFYSEPMVEGSRGCLYQCNYCQEYSMRRHYLEKPIDNLISEIENLMKLHEKHYGSTSPVSTFFSDPLWGRSEDWVWEFCQKLKKLQKDFQSRFIWRVSMRVDQKLDHLFSLMWETGCRGIGFGLESFHPEMLKSMNKSPHPDKYAQNILSILTNAVNTCAVYGGYITVTLLFGWPGENMRNIFETFERLKTIKKEIGENAYLMDVLLETAIPFPGIKLVEILDNEELKKKYGLQWVVPRRFWKDGILPWLPMFNPNKTISAMALASYARGLFESGEAEKAQTESLWYNDTTFLNKLKTQDILTKEEVMHYAHLIRADYEKVGDFRPKW